MKIITGTLMLSAFLLAPAPALAQGDLQHQIERIADYALTLAADALGELVDERRDQRNDRQDRQRDSARRDDQDPEFRDTFTRTVRLGRNGRLELENVSGDVEVTGSSGEEVRITATKTVRAATEAAARGALNATVIQVNERPGVVTIASESTRGRFGSVEVDYAVSVPSGTHVTVKTISGDITVRNIAGDVQLNSMSGDLIVSESRPRAVEADVVSGDVSLEKVDSGRIRVKTVSGDIILSGRIDNAGRYELHTHSGDVQVIPEGNPGFEVDAQTFSGDINSDFALRVPGALRNSFGANSRSSRRDTSIRGIVNDGGAMLSLKSFSGDILITKR